MGASWALSNKNPPNFTLMSMLMLSNPQSMSKMNFINCKKDIGGKMEFNSQFYLTDSVSLKFEGYMPNEQIETSHTNLEVLKEFNDCHIAYKIGGGSQSISMMQGITDNLSAGFEAMWHPMEKKFIYNYGMKWVKDQHTFLASYIPIA
jgi:hypothetical protein